MTRSFLWALLLLASCGSRHPEEFSRTRLLMGTTVSITVLDRDERRALTAIEDAFTEIARVDRLMSTWRETSQVSRLNREGRVAAGPQLLHVLARSRLVSEISGGAFDITVKPVLDLLTDSFSETGGPPEPPELEARLRLVDYRQVVVEGDVVSLPAGVEIALGGIAKGYAIDLAVAALERGGIDHVLVNAGGDLGALGDRAGESWRLAVRDPLEPEGLLATISLSGESVATSGGYERFFDAEGQWHHLIDPRTGKSAGGVASVTVTAGSALEADALATAVFVMGEIEGLALVEALDGVEALLVIDGGAIIASTGMRYRLTRSR